VTRGIVPTRKRIENTRHSFSHATHFRPMPARHSLCPVALGEATTMEILEYGHPWPADDRRQRKKRARAVCLAARKTIASPARLWHTATELTETAEPAEPDAKRALLQGCGPVPTHRSMRMGHL